MNILLIQREGTDLHHILFASETSRLALRFYHPKKLPCGVKISVASLGSALSLVSEMRWYLRRYVRETLFEVEHGIYCTQAIAQDIYYKRTPIPGKPWAYRRFYGFSHGKLARQIVMSPGSSAQDYLRETAGTDTTLEVWCTEDEVDDIGEPIPLDDTGEMPGARDNPEL